MDSHECPQRHRVNEEEFAGQQRQDSVPGGVCVRTLECSVGQGHPPSALGHDTTFRSFAIELPYNPQASHVRG